MNSARDTSSPRKSSAAREDDLRLAIFRIERARAHTKATKLSISSVAREAGVTPALIHNHYPAIAELIRVKQGASSREQRDAKHDELRKEKDGSRDLRQELKEARVRLAQLASINESLLVENQNLRARLGAGNVISLGPRGSGS